MFILGYSGYRRHGWWEPASTRAARLHHAAAHDTLFDVLTTFGDTVDSLPMNVFPIDGVSHDAAAAILDDGRLVAAAAEERFNRFKHSTAVDGSTLPPRRAAAYCLEEAGIALDQVEHVAFYCDMSDAVYAERTAQMEPHLSPDIRERVLDGYRAVYERTASNDRIAEESAEVFGDRVELHFVPHHLAHASSSFYGSGFGEAGVLTVDGYGERSSSAFLLGGPDGLQLEEETPLPGSLGMVYMVLTVFLGFRPLDGEYKVMGLASYGDPRPYRAKLDALLDIADDGHCRSPSLLRGDFAESMRETFGPPRRQETEITRREMDIAAALQQAFEDAMDRRLTYLKERYGIDRICLAGGCALNSVYNGKLAASGLFDEIFVFPAAGDDGCSVGAAQFVHHDVLGRRPRRRALRRVAFGPAYGEQDVAEALARHSDEIELAREPEIERRVAQELADGKVVGWFRGRMEFGPRALGGRSILADPREESMRQVLNERVKRREEFRPFAPSVIAEAADDYFDMLGLPSARFMQYVVPATERGAAAVPAAVHFDGSARVQTVDRADDEDYWRLIAAFGELTGVPVILNTSFNVRGEPIVCTPADAVRCFLSTEIDVLAIEGCVATKVTAPRAR
jgi:carbamoyltransferase